MRNFILFVRRFFNLILFLGLEIVCIVLITKTSTMQGNDITSSANAVAGVMYQKQNDVVYYFGLRKMNDSLLNENTRLRATIDKIRSVDTLHDSVAQVSTGKTDSLTHLVKYANYIYRTARVINNSVSSANNYITVNRGEADGIRKGMMVTSGSGVVGRVEHTTAHFASILSVLSVKWGISVALKDGTYGYTTWNNLRPDVLEVQDIPQQIRVKNGDSVFTTNVSFPQGILVGTVFKGEAIKKNSMQRLSVHPSTNFRNLQYVYVLENTMAKERSQLEDSTKGK